jgi:HD-GYP domain-containing protein (c-di-GMP phosphodiesterase class II)
VYRPAVDRRAVLEMIVASAGKQFDPDVANAMVSIA